MKVKKVNIVCSDQGWIYTKFISMIRMHSKHQILLNSNENCDTTFYLPYYEIPNIPKHPCSIWLSHQEQRKDLYDKFLFAAKNSDFSISHSKKYMDLMVAQGTKNIVQIVPGIDLKKFCLRPKERHNKNKLIVGFVGRQYNSSNRKNPKLLEKMSKLSFVDFKATGGRVRETDMPLFYSSLDVIVSPALTEGGPLCISEGLAVGVPTICFEGVGVADEFSNGVIRVPFGKDEMFIERLKIFWNNKEYQKYRDIDTMRSLRSQVEQFSWENFVLKLDEVWDNLCKQ